MNSSEKGTRHCLRTTILKCTGVTKMKLLVFISDKSTEGNIKLHTSTCLFTIRQESGWASELLRASGGNKVSLPLQGGPLIILMTFF